MSSRQGLMMWPRDGPCKKASSRHTYVAFFCGLQVRFFLLSVHLCREMQKNCKKKKLELMIPSPLAYVYARVHEPPRAADPQPVVRMRGGAVLPRAAGVDGVFVVARAPGGAARQPIGRRGGRGGGQRRRMGRARGRVGTLHHVVLQSRHPLMTAVWSM
jgi:hypothetical protein